MEQSFFHRLSRVLWSLLVVLVVILAIYVSFGRMLTVNLTPWRAAILQELNARVPFTVEAQQVSGQWQFFSPDIVLTGLRISFPESSNAPLELSEGRIGLDVLNSMRTASLQMTRLELSELSLRGELSRTGQLRLTGFGDGEGERAADGDSDSDDEGGVSEELREFLLNVEWVTLNNNLLKLTMPSGEVRDLDLNLVLLRDGSHRHVEAKLTSTAGTRIAIIAEGVGDPFQPELFSGEAYLDIQSPDLGAVRDMLADRTLPGWAEGALDLELWLDWDKGHPAVEARLEGRDLLIAGPDSSWEIPLDRVALQARLLERKNGWVLFASDLQIAKDDVTFTLPRMQLDAWDKAVRVRATDVPLEPLNAILTDLEPIPEALRRVFATLQPRGQLTALQLSTVDTDNPTKNWEVGANFEGVEVEPYTGAPGLSSATGYTRLTQDGGIVLFDSQPLTLEFPTIFPQPLHFEDVHGTLHIDWDADTVSLASGVLTTQGEEGMAKVLFGLTIPRVPDEVGIEMDLLVGLQDTHPVHRVKYIPHVLAPTLLTWLSDSIGEGHIEQGAFLWRGSLKKNAAQLRTVQLAFNVADTHLSYHREWPPVLVDKGVVLIDDAAVSVWADRASLFESTVENLSVETWLNEQSQIMLAIEGSVLGNAADGLKVLNESPLAGIVGPTFSQWNMDGDLETDLQVRLNLSDKSVTPRVDVATRWHDVNLLVMPGNLPIEAVNGEFNYSTTKGFSSSSLVGELWGKAVSADLQQRHGEGQEDYDPAQTVLDIELDAQVDMADVRSWLGLQPLAFVSGQTTADVGIQLAPGEPPLLRVNSELQGVSLDLPRPWQKSADQPRQMHLQMPLVSGGMSLLIENEQQLNLRLDIVDGALRGGSLGLNVEPTPPREGRLHISGHAPLIEGEEWLAFVKKYFGDDSLGFQARRDTDTTAAVGADTDSDAGAGLAPESGVGPRQVELPPPPLEIVIEEVHADTLVVMEQELQDARFSLTMSSLGSSFSLQTDWLQGDLTLAADGSASRVDIEHLDIDRLDQFELSDQDTGATGDFPSMEVILRNLFQGSQRLGELSFELQSQGDELIAQNITGELAHFRLRAEQPGRLVWHPGSEGFSELQANLGFEDLGQTLEYFGYQRIVETEGGEFDLDLHWPGPPADFSLEALEGSMQIAIGPGSFPEAPSGAAGALRVVNILNLADIVRRLSLADKFDSGIPFYSVEGEIYFHSGVLEVARMDVQGSSSFQFSGVSDLQTQSLDGELVATLPVARNLPWIAALAASLPVAAGVFVVSKIFDKQMNRLSSAVYSIDGFWNDPQVSFDRIFDNTKRITGESLFEAGIQADGATVDKESEPLPAQTTDVQAPIQSASP